MPSSNASEPQVVKCCGVFWVFGPNKISWPIILSNMAIRSQTGLLKHKYRQTNTTQSCHIYFPSFPTFSTCWEVILEKLKIIISGFDCHNKWKLKWKMWQTWSGGIALCLSPGREIIGAASPSTLPAVVPFCLRGACSFAAVEGRHIITTNEYAGRASRGFCSAGQLPKNDNEGPSFAPPAPPPPTPRGSRCTQAARLQVEGSSSHCSPHNEI